jgi:hypothetical protein
MVCLTVVMAQVNDSPPQLKKLKQGDYFIENDLCDVSESDLCDVIAERNSNPTPCEELRNQSNRGQGELTSGENKELSYAPDTKFRCDVQRFVYHTRQHGDYKISTTRLILDSVS